MKHTFVAPVLLGVVAGITIVGLFSFLYVIHEENEEIHRMLEKNAHTLEHISLLLDNTNIQWQQ